MLENTVHMPVAEAYDRWSRNYDGHDNPMVHGARHVLATLGHAFKGRAVFEFGCGTGANLLAALRMGAASVGGCDLSPGMLARAREKAPSLPLLEHDMTLPLPLPGGGVDCALFCLSLEHVASLTAPLGEAARLLAPGGSVEVIEIHPAVSLGGVAAHFRDNDETVRMPTFAHGFADHLNAFHAAGLHVAACREWRPLDFDAAATPKMLKRGAAHPLLVHFSLRKQG